MSATATATITFSNKETNKESLNKIRKICAIKYNPATLPQAINKCKQLLTGQDRCLCSVLPSIIQLNSMDLATQAIALCKNNCKLCQIKIEYLYDILQPLPFYITQRAISLKLLQNKPDVLLSILSDHLYEINQSYIQEIVEILFTNITENVQHRNKMYLFRIISIIEKHIKLKKRIKKDAIFVLFYEIVKYANILIATQRSYNSEEVDDFITYIVNHITLVIRIIIEYDMLDQLDIYKIMDLMFSHFTQFRSAIYNGFKRLHAQNEIDDPPPIFKTIEDQHLYNHTKMFGAINAANAYITKALIGYTQQIHYIDNQLYSFIFQLQYNDISVIIRKATANCMMRLVSTELRYRRTIELFEIHVDPLHMINSTICKNMNLPKTMAQFSNLSQKPYVIYENENGQLGIDAGGLTRDFFSQYFLQLKGAMIPADDIYMTFGQELREANSLARIRFAGVLTAYSILQENISPNLRFHPIISYFIVNGSTIRIDDLLDFLAKYDIEYIRNVRKILDYSPEEFREYMDIQGEDDAAITPKEYLNTLIHERYITPQLIAFIRGFRNIFIQLEKNELCHFINPAMIHNYMSGIESYMIIGQTNTLESILKIDCGDDASMPAAKKQMVKQAFLDILQELNLTDFGKLKDFMRFWHGTHAIQDFQYLDLTLRIFYGEDDQYGCFSSSTCFGKLYIHHSYLSGIQLHVLKRNLLDHIERTLENQRIVESAGMYMQLD